LFPERTGAIVRAPRHIEEKKARVNNIKKVLFDIKKLSKEELRFLLIDKNYIAT